MRETDEESKKCVKWLIIAFKEFFVVGFLFGFATTTESSIVLCSGRRYGRLIVCKITAIVFLSTCNYSSSCNPPTSPVHQNYYLHRQPSPPPPSLIGETKWQRRDCSHQFSCSWEESVLLQLPLPRVCFAQDVHSLKDHSLSLSLGWKSETPIPGRSK